MTNTYILYHAGCLDGFGAAYAASKHFGDAAQYIPVQYNQAPPELVAGSQVYIVDFSYDLATLQQLQAEHELVMVLDHHQTAQEALLGYRDSVFDMSRSGAVITWGYFHPGQELPQLLAHVQDRDLWRFELPYTKEITAALWLSDRSFEAWHKLATNPEALAALVPMGALLLKQQDQTVANQAKSSYRKTLPHGEGIWVVNSPAFPSETAQAIMALRGVDIAATWVEDGDGTRYSVRSRGEGDASALAKSYGGGGHHHAAGFRL